MFIRSGVYALMFNLKGIHLLLDLILIFGALPQDGYRKDVSVVLCFHYAKSTAINITLGWVIYKEQRCIIFKHQSDVRYLKSVLHNVK